VRNVDIQKPLCAFHTLTVVSLDADITNTQTQQFSASLASLPKEDSSVHHFLQFTALSFLIKINIGLIIFLSQVMVHNEQQV